MSHTVCSPARPLAFLLAASLVGLACTGDVTDRSNAPDGSAAGRSPGSTVASPMRTPVPALSNAEATPTETLTTPRPSVFATESVGVRPRIILLPDTGVRPPATVVASWYGPGFFGNRTACGQVYDATIIGVAHRGLPCGTLVTLRYRGLEVTVPVIDRGPYIAGRELDLSAALNDFLGCGLCRVEWVR